MNRLTPASEARSRRHLEESDGADGRPAKLLIVDDERAVRIAVARTLGREGYEIEAVASAQHALEAVRAGRFDAVVTDICMPGMDGLQLMSALQSIDADLPVVLMTGTPSIATAIDAVRLGALNYVTKPFENDQLAATARRAVMLGRMARLRRESENTIMHQSSEDGAAFDRALEQLFMVYQPIVDESRAAVGYEALVRSAEPTLPHPGAIFDAAEKLGRLQQLGRAIRRLCASSVLHLRPSALLYVNLHATDLLDEDLYDPSTPLAKAASRVVLEITERANLDHVDDVEMRVARLRAIGFRIAIDDIGAGYAGLTSFARLEPDVVKLDMTLVRDIDAAPLKQKLVQSMTRLCGGLGIRVVAEGVETEAEHRTVVELGCDLLQGYLFAKPGKPLPTVAPASLQRSAM